jgi:superfamily II DNA/RNA helicase
MIATEAAAEGINLQFCSLVVNYAITTDDGDKEALKQI